MNSGKENGTCNNVEYGAGVVAQLAECLSYMLGVLGSITALHKQPGGSHL